METKVKRQRVVGTKYSRNACRTCRIRRIKCDEGTSCCRNCVSTGRTCDGYSSLASGSQIVAPERPLLSAPAASTTGLTPSLSSILFSTNSDDKQSFRYFQDNIVIGLAHISPHDWTNIALQLSQSEPAIYYAMSALGSIARERLTENGHTFYTPPTQVQSGLALKQYCKAIALLHKYIGRAMSGQASTEPVILCCLLFVIYQIYQGDISLAIAHLRLGCRITEGSNLGLGVGKVKENQLEPFSATLTWLASDSLCFAQAPVLLGKDRQAEPPIGLPTISSTYSASIAHAKQVLDSLVSAGLKWRAELLKRAEKHIAGTQLDTYRHALRVCIIACLSRSIEFPTGHGLLRQLSTLIRDHEAWLSAMAVLSNHQHSMVILMQIQHFASLIVLEESRATSSSPMDDMEPRFAHALNLVDEYIRARQQEPNPPRARSQKIYDPYSPLPQRQEDSFSLEYAILPTLFLACLKCRSHEIRQRALILLRTINRREGLQYSGELVNYADSIVALEESAVCIENGRHVPEKARVLEVTIESVGFLKLNLLCGRYRHEDDGRLEIIEYRGAGLPPLRLQPLVKHVFPFQG